MKIPMKTVAAGALLALALSVARADDVPENTIRVGMYYVQYHSTADDISGPYVPNGLNLHVNSIETLYLAYVRRLSEHFDLELAAGAPPTTKTEGRGPATLGSVPYNGQVISTAKWFAPTLLLNYKFLDDSYALRPYIGIGVNYANFYDRRSTAASSVGVAGTVGVSYRLPERWSLYLSYSMSEVKSKLTADTAGVIRTSQISFGPRALVIAAGYSFGK
jgi:outer membrane protein